MTRGTDDWAVHLMDAAQADLHHIASWTAENFGRRQALVYRETVAAAVEALRAGPEVVGVKTRDDVLHGLMTLHVARNRRKGRHLLVFRVADRARTVEVLRILHDAMDLRRHVASPEEGGR